jgi:hypothetical protein
MSISSDAIEAQASIDRDNAAFWDEKCSSQIARQLGVTGNDRSSLQRFDDWFFAFYPYLEQMIDFAGVAGKDVLQVGLGFGSVSQRLAEGGARLTGLDIVAGPVAGLNRRLRQGKLSGAAIQGSVLATMRHWIFLTFFRQRVHISVKSRIVGPTASDCDYLRVAWRRWLSIITAEVLE